MFPLQKAPALSPRKNLSHIMLMKRKSRPTNSTTHRHVSVAGTSLSIGLVEMRKTRRAPWSSDQPFSRSIRLVVAPLPLGSISGELSSLENQLPRFPFVSRDCEIERVRVNQMKGCDSCSLIRSLRYPASTRELQNELLCERHCRSEELGRWNDVGGECVFHR